MSNTTKGKSAETAPEAGPVMDPVFDALEKRVESLAQRLRELAAENGRLKAAGAAAAAERDRLKAELSSVREQASRPGDEDPRIAKYEAERDAVRERLERLIRSLEGVEAPLPS